MKNFQSTQKLFCVKLMLMNRYTQCTDVKKKTFKKKANTAFDFSELYHIPWVTFITSLDLICASPLVPT